MSQHDHVELTIAFAVDRALKGVQIEIPQSIINEAVHKALKPLEDPIFGAAFFRDNMQSAIEESLRQRTKEIVTERLRNDTEFTAQVNQVITETCVKVFSEKRDLTIDRLVDKLTDALSKRFEDYD